MACTDQEQDRFYHSSCLNIISDASKAPVLNGWFWQYWGILKYGSHGSSDLCHVQEVDKDSYNLLELIQGTSWLSWVRWLVRKHRWSHLGWTPAKKSLCCQRAHNTMLKYCQNHPFRTGALEVPEMTFKHDQWLKISNAQSVQAASKQNQLIICLYEEL